MAGSEEAPSSESIDTIVAVSTAVGVGAIGIVRLSGPQAVAIAEGAFRPARGEGVKPEESYRLLYGHVVDPADGSVVDEALLAIMRRPHSYTREDVVELHCHGGVAAQRAVLRLMIREGARVAEPGEFTRRAFLNGRIDLAQAEGVASIVSARSSGALRASVRQLEGGLSRKLAAARKELISVLGRVEATVDFADEDVDELDWGSVAGELTSVQAELAALLRTAFVGRALEQGIRTAIVGRPNVGKSSLLNALLSRERAIVSDIPGTTRDTVEELMELGGIPIHLVDTAGIRAGGDDLERLGVARSLQAMERADLVLAVMDLSAPWQEADRDMLRGADHARTIVVGNKADLVEDGELRTASLSAFLWGAESVRGVGEQGECGEGNEGRHARVAAVSALTGSGLDELRGLIEDVVTGGQGLHLEEPVLAGERQRALVKEASERTRGALAAVELAADEELVCEDVRAAVGALGRMTGEDLTEDLLDEIFSRFCIGK